MPTVVGIEFRSVTKVYHFDPAGYSDLLAGEYVVVDTAQGREVGKVVTLPKDVPPQELNEPLKPVVRRASAWDMLQKDQYQHQEAEALKQCKQKVLEQDIPMKVVRTEYNYDGGRLMIYYSAEKRVDFRNLVREFAKIFKTRIEMKQIGARDEAKLLDGVGRCGRRLCCSSWLREFYQISIKMAKTQDLPLNPSEISGVCGRLLCCLSYENEAYSDLKKALPKVGATVKTPKGTGVVQGVFALKERVEVRLEDETLAVFDAAELETDKKGGGRSCSTCGGCSLTRRLAGQSPASDAAGAG
ncbi:MAG: stage 0 sporulation family protein [Anaerolineae bacterium]|nr:stage 0 sporulation family protein [Anaerolineae bacterium]